MLLFRTLTSLLVFASVALAQYTVQAAALSNSEAALALMQRLDAAGYPAYLVSADDLYRVRIGLFADRESALRFSRGLADLENPSLALAENLPPSLVPRSTAFVASFPHNPEFTSLRFYRWGEGVALRHQGRYERTPLEASYTLLNAGNTHSFTAWRASPQGDGSLLRVYSQALWPEDWATLTDEQLIAFDRGTAQEIARSLGISHDEFRRYTFFQPGTGVPYVVLAERYEPRTGARERLRAIGDPQDVGHEAGPRLMWLSDTIPSGFERHLPEPIFDPYTVLPRYTDFFATELPAAERLNLANGSFALQPDGPFVRLRYEPERAYRVAAGYPLWLQGEYLLSYDNGELVLYALRTP